MGHSDDDYDLKCLVSHDDQNSIYQDLSNRYEAIVDTQFSALSNFEDKAWRTIRATVALIGIYLTGVSVIIEFSNGSATLGLAEIIAISIGLASLLSSTYYAIKVLSSVTVGFGPGTELAEDVIEDPDDSSHGRLLLESYTNAINENWSAIGTKSSDLSKSLKFLFFGVVEVTLGLALFINPITEFMFAGGDRLHVLEFIIVIVASILMYHVSDNIENNDDSGEQKD